MDRRRWQAALFGLRRPHFDGGWSPVLNQLLRDRIDLAAWGSTRSDKTVAVWA